MLIRDAISKLGYEETQTGDLCIARIKGGRIVQSTLANCHGRALDVLGDVYVATGAFRKGAIQPYAGRTQENLVRVVDLPFDFDLHDYLGCPKDDVLALPDGVLSESLGALAADALELLSVCGIPCTLTLRTGYGLLALSRLAVPDQLRASDATALHASLLQQVNDTFGDKIADPRVKDAGTRLIRLPGSFNHKNPDNPRPVEILEERDDLLHLDDFDFERKPALPPRRIIPDHAAQLSEDEERKIVLAVAEHWDEGVRHGLSLGLSAMLGKANVPREQARRIVAACAVDDPETRDRIKAVDTTYDRIEKGLSASGYYGLRELLPHKTVEYVDHLLAPRFASRDLGAIDITMLDSRRERGEKRPAPAALPEEAFYGWFGRYERLMGPTTEACGAFHLAVAITFAGAYIGRRVKTFQGTPLYPNLYSILVGSTGRSRKDTAIDRGAWFFSQSHDGEPFLPPWFPLAGLASGEGLIDHLIDHPHTLVRVSEFSETVRKAGRAATNTLMTTLTNVWDGRRVSRPKAGSSVSVDEPFLSLLGGIPPETLADDMSTADIASGFANRALWVFGTQAAEPLDDPPMPDQAMSAWLYRELREAMDSYPLGAVLHKDAAAKAMWRDWYRRQWAVEYETSTDAMLAQRMASNIHKVALVFACAEAATVITEAHLRAATALVEWVFDHARLHARKWGWGEESRIGGAILDILACGPVSRRDINVMVGENVSPILFDRVLEALVRNDRVGLCSPGVYGLL